MILPYLTAHANVHIKICKFAHDSHNQYVYYTANQKYSVTTGAQWGIGHIPFNDSSMFSYAAS